VAAETSVEREASAEGKASAETEKQKVHNTESEVPGANISEARSDERTVAWKIL
jgi:hypothetical protein